MSIADLPPAVAQQINEATQDNPDLMQQLIDNPEMLAQVLEGYDTELSAISDEQAMAENLRGRANTEGTHAGNQFVAASPLSHIADVGNNFMADRQGKDLIGQKRQIGQQENQQTRNLADLLRGSGSQPMQPVQTATPPQAEAGAGGILEKLKLLMG